MSSDTAKQNENGEGFRLAGHRKIKLKSSETSHYGRQARPESPPMQLLASGAQHSESSAAYFHWPPSSQLQGTAEERAACFSDLPNEIVSEREEEVSAAQQATTLLDLMTIRAYYSKVLRQFSLATAIGFRTRQGVPTTIPAIIVFVARKVHKEWLPKGQILPSILEGPGGFWCDVDVVEFSYYGASTVTPKEQVYTELVDGLRGNCTYIGPGSQVASQQICGTLGAIVQSKTGLQQVGFLTNRHVAVDLDYPNQKMFHPLPPNLGPSIYLGAVERATSFITDENWYGIFASKNPEAFVRADGAFIPFGDSFDVLRRVTTTVTGVGDMGGVMEVDLRSPIASIVGKHVVKVGRSSGLTRGSIMAYALEYNDEKGICFFTDFLIVGENKQVFDLEGDSGSLVLLVGAEGEKPRPVGIIWGGTANRGRLKLRNGDGPESWTSGVDLGRLLDQLQLDLVTSNSALAEAVEVQRHWMARLAMGSMVGESSPWGMVDKVGVSEAFDLQTRSEQQGEATHPTKSGRITNSDEQVWLGHHGEADQTAGDQEISMLNLETQPQQKSEVEVKFSPIVLNCGMAIDLVGPATVPLVELELMEGSDFKFVSVNVGAEADQYLSTLQDDDSKELCLGLDLFNRDPKRRSL